MNRSWLYGACAVVGLGLTLRLATREVREVEVAQAEVEVLAPRLEAAPIASSPAPRSDRAVSALMRATADLARRVDELERAEPVDAEVEVANRITARDEETARLTAQYESLVSDHALAPVDAAWANDAARTLTQELSEWVADKESTLLTGVDCKSTSCVAHLEFASGTDARSGAPELVSRFYGVNCATSLRLSDAAPADAPQQVDLVFHDCVRDPA